MSQNLKIRCYCLYYSYSPQHGKRILFKWRTNNVIDSRKCLARFNQSTGWHQEERNGIIVKNYSIAKY